MSAVEMPDFGTCDTCQQALYGGSHYHCPCGSKDVTGMYGHHSGVCKLDPTDTKGRIKSGPFHHCGPNGDCELRGDGMNPHAALDDSTFAAANPLSLDPAGRLFMLAWLRGCLLTDTLKADDWREAYGRAADYQTVLNFRELLTEVAA